MNLNKNVLSTLTDLYNKGILICAVQFGSSIYRPESPNDIDIVLVIKDEKLEKFVKFSGGLFSKKYDISLVLESEITQNFYFGGHGIYLVEAFQNGIVLAGTNIFIEKYKKINEIRIKKAVFERMKEYVSVLRKSYFNDDKNKLFIFRYLKFLKLSLYLNGFFSYLDSIKMKETDVLCFYKKIWALT